MALDVRPHPDPLPVGEGERRQGAAPAPLAYGTRVRRNPRRRYDRLWPLPLWAVLLVCCGLPLGWFALQIVLHPASLARVWPDAWYLRLLGRTLGYNFIAALIATLLGLPAAIVLGRGRGWAAVVLWFALPASLLLPSLAYTYGWSQFIRLCADPLGRLAWHLPAGARAQLESLGIVVHLIGRPDGGASPRLVLVLAGPADVARCIWSLGTWLWPLPAGIIGLSLRRLDANLQQQALLDGALWRVTFRQLAGPVVASLACTTILAAQEFAVYEPTGISVVATELRQVFQTGLVSSAQNPITAPFGGGANVVGGWSGQSPNLAPVVPPDSPSPDQAGRAAACVATALPLMAVVFALGGLALWAGGRTPVGDDVEAGGWPGVLDAGWRAKLLAVGVVFIAVVVPVASMAVAHQRRVDLVQIWRQSGPEVGGSIFLAALAAGAAAVVAFVAAVRRVRGTLPLALVSFLVGGQLLAIALIRLYNRPHLGWVYDAPPIMVMAYLARFSWLALLAAGATFAGPWRALRDLSAVDGAGELRTALHVVWPLAWPLLLASALLVGVLSLTEVPATVLISPLRPEPIVPKLMSWVHILENDPMIEASLLLAALALSLSVIAAALVWFGLRIARGGVVTSAARRTNPPTLVGGLLLCVGLLPSLTGCGNSAEPEAIWCDTGTGPGQVVYPRAIAYNKQDDTFVIIDRLARVQRLDRDGHFLNEWRMPDWQTGKPVGVTVGPDGNIYVPDTHYHRVVVYAPDGNEIRRWGSEGTGPGQFIFPTDVAFDSTGRVFVSEYGNNDRIQVFDREGTFLYAIGKFGGGDGEFSRPQSIVIDGDTLYVADACNHRINVFKTNGAFVRNMGGPGQGPGQFRFPYGMDLDPDGHLVVCEFGNNRVQRIDKETGKSLAVWGGPGHEPGRFAYPWGVAVSKRDRVVAVDAGNNRLQVFEF